MKNRKQFKKSYEELYAHAPKKDLLGDKWQKVCEVVHEHKRQVVVDEILRNKNYSICDIGCGTGRVLEKLRKQGFKGKLTAIDIHLPAKLLERAKKFNIKIIQSNFNNVKSSNYDGILFFSALHYATLKEVDKIIKNTFHCNDYYIDEAFIEHSENSELDKKVRGKTNNKCGLFYEKELDQIFLDKGFKKVYTHEFQKDNLDRIHTFNHYESLLHRTVKSNREEKKND